MGKRLAGLSYGGDSLARRFRSYDTPKPPRMNFPTMHCSVNRYGLVSLWDTEAQARGVTDEEYVCLELSANQTALFDAAVKNLR